MVSEKKILLRYSNYKSVGVNDPRGIANLDPRGKDGRIYVGDHYTLLHTKYMSCRPHGFREDVLRFSNYKSVGANDPRGMVKLNPGAWLAGFM